MLNFFLSYSREDADAIARLSNDLVRIGHTVWTDKKLTGTQKWWPTVLNQIEKCDVFVFTISPNSVNSEACKLEYTYASQLKKRIFPIRVKGEVSLQILPLEISSLQLVDYRLPDKDAFINMMNAINSLPAAEPMPKTMPVRPPVPISYLGDLMNEINSKETLSFEVQTALFIKLKRRLSNDKDRGDVIQMLQRFRKRDDLQISEEIDNLDLETIPQKKSNKASEILVDRQVEQLPTNINSWKAIILDPDNMGERVQIEATFNKEVHLFEIIRTTGFFASTELLVDGSSFEHVLSNELNKEFSISADGIEFAFRVHIKYETYDFNVQWLQLVVDNKVVLKHSSK